VVPYGDLAAIEAAITPNTVAIMLEPIQGEAGIIVPPAGYLRGIRRLATEHRIIMVLDEIQTGLGRTGRLLAEEHEGVQADVTLVGKALSGGVYPISAVLADKATLGVFKPGEHGSTYGGNPLACAVAREAMRVLFDEGLIENADELGNHALAHLRGMKSDAIREVRGKGLMIGIELKPEVGGARPICERLMKRGLLCKETHTHTIRIAPPLVITRQQVDWMLENLEAVLGDAGN
jgi:ornithine--oxo-acid transaminase